MSLTVTEALETASNIFWCWKPDSKRKLYKCNHAWMWSSKGLVTQPFTPACVDWKKQSNDECVGLIHLKVICFTHSKMGAHELTAPGRAVLGISGMRNRGAYWWKQDYREKLIFERLEVGSVAHFSGSWLFFFFLETSDNKIEWYKNCVYFSSSLIQVWIQMLLCLLLELLYMPSSILQDSASIPDVWKVLYSRYVTASFLLNHGQRIALPKVSGDLKCFMSKNCWAASVYLDFWSSSLGFTDSSRLSPPMLHL